MLKKLILAVALLAVACGVSAADFVTISFNFYTDGAITPEKELPEGIVQLKKVRFHNKKIFGFGHPFRVNLDKHPSVELSFKVKGEGKIVVSVSPNGGKTADGKRIPAPELKCTEFVLNGKPVKTPFTFKKWKAAAPEIHVADGDVITVKAAFEKVE